ncbi:MAG: phosphotransferase enzyme family protein [Ilumatobacteraceae bacterium]
MADGVPADIEQMRLVVRACAEQALRHWELDVVSLEFVTMRENAVFRADTVSGRSFAVRVHRPGYHTVPELESEVEWTTALRAAGIDTPEVMRTRSGAAYAEVPWGDGTSRMVGLSEWVSGEVLAASLLEPSGVEVCRRLGALTAQLHEHTSRWTPSTRFTRHRLDLDGLLGDAPWWGRFWDVPEITAEQRPVVDAAREYLAGMLCDLGTAPHTFGLIHADLLPHNVLVHDGRPYVIDFDDAAFGWHHYDMATSLYDIADPTLRAERRDALVAGYRTVREFSPSDEAMLPAFHVLRQFQVIGWMHPRIDAILAVNQRPESRADVMSARLERAVADAVQLLESSPR